MRTTVDSFLESLESRCLLADSGFISVGSKVFFNYYGDAEHGQELWATDGTPEGTAALGDGQALVANRANGLRLADQLFFTGTPEAGTGAIWIWDLDGNQPPELIT